MCSTWVREMLNKCFTPSILYPPTREKKYWVPRYQFYFELKKVSSKKVKISYPL